MTATLVRGTPLGALELELARADLADEIAALALEAARTERRGFGRRVALGDAPAYLKGGALRGGALVRHALRERVLRELPARRNEARNLRWLDAHGLPTVAPLAVAVLRRSGVARFQALATEWVAEARTLAVWWPAAGTAERQDVLTHLARDVGRMHGLGFVHRDLFFRNLLVAPPTPEEGGPRARLIDCWRGGPGHRWRGPAYDLACLMVDAAGAWTGADQQHFFAAYLEERRLHGGADLAELLGRARRQHAALARRLVRRGYAAPAPWEPPPLWIPTPSARPRHARKA